MCWILLLLLALQPCTLILGQNPDVVSSCIKYKKKVFEEQVGYSFLFPNAPVHLETIDNCKSYTPLIVGGEAANPKEFPSMARIGRRQELQDKIDWFCGGTLISENFVMTAAHCLESEYGEINVVRLGELDFDTDQDDALPKNYAVANYFVHPNFTNPELYNDIGLIKLAEPVQFDRYKHPACLPYEDGQRFQNFTAIGWGSTKLAGRESGKLLKVKLELVADAVCRRVIEEGEEYPHGFEAISQLCVGSSKPMDTCTGDSGGPIFVSHLEYPCMYHVMGVTSTGLACGTPKIPSVYTRVHYYLDWIRRTIDSN